MSPGPGKIFPIPLLSGDRNCDTGASPPGKDDFPPCSQVVRPRGRGEALRGRKGWRVARRTTIIVRSPGHCCIRPRWRAVACKSGCPWTRDGFGRGSRRIHRDDPFSGLTNPTAIRFSPDGRVFVAEKSGVIKVFASSPTRRRPSLPTCGRTSTTSGIVASSGMALPASSVPDRSRPSTSSTPTTTSSERRRRPAWGRQRNSDGCPTPPGADHRRLRGQRPPVAAAAVSGTTMTGPEQVLIEDWCQQFPSHSIGSLAFGADGALYVSGGRRGELQRRRLRPARRPGQPVRRSPGQAVEPRPRRPPRAARSAARTSGARHRRRPATTPAVVMDDAALAYWRLGEASAAVVDRRAGPPAPTTGTVIRDVSGALLNGDDGAIDFNGSSGWHQRPRSEQARPRQRPMDDRGLGEAAIAAARHGFYQQGARARPDSASSPTG